MDNQSLSTIVPRGTKRLAEESLERDQRLAKKLSRLSLGGFFLLIN